MGYEVCARADGTNHRGTENTEKTKTEDKNRAACVVCMGSARPVFISFSLPLSSRCSLCLCGSLPECWRRQGLAADRLRDGVPLAQRLPRRLGGDRLPRHPPLAELHRLVAAG